MAGQSVTVEVKNRKETGSRANKRLLGVPDWNGSGGIQYEIEAPMLGGSITPRIDWFYTGSIAFSANNVAYNQSPYSTFNGRLSYTNKEYDATLSLNVTNMFNKFYYSRIGASLDGFQLYGVPGAGRTVTASVDYSF